MCYSPVRDTCTCNYGPRYKLIRDKLQWNLQKGDAIYNHGIYIFKDDETQMSNAGKKDTRNREGHASQHVWEIQAFSRNSGSLNKARLVESLKNWYNDLGPINREFLNDKRSGFSLLVLFSH